MVTGIGRKVALFFTASVPGLAYLIWIDAFIWLLKENRYRAFLQPRLWPLLVFAVFVLLLFFLLFVFQDESHTTERPWKKIWISAIILCLPVLFLYIAFDRGLGTNSFSKQVSASVSATNIPGIQTSKKGSADLPDGPLTLLQVVKNLDRLSGKRVTTVGSVYKDKNIPKGNLMLFRFAIYCCAADAVPIWILVETETIDRFKNEDWIEVQGRLSLNKIQNQDIPVIKAENIRMINKPPPPEQYLFF